MAIQSWTLITQCWFTPVEHLVYNNSLHNIAYMKSLCPEDLTLERYNKVISITEKKENKRKQNKKCFFFRNLFLDEVKINNLAALSIKILVLVNSCLLESYQISYHQYAIQTALIDVTCTKSLQCPWCIWGISGFHLYKILCRNY